MQSLLKRASPNTCYLGSALSKQGNPNWRLQNHIGMRVMAGQGKDSGPKLALHKDDQGLLYTKLNTGQSHLPDLVGRPQLFETCRKLICSGIKSSTGARGPVKARKWLSPKWKQSTQHEGLYGICINSTKVHSCADQVGFGIKMHQTASHAVTASSVTASLVTKFWPRM